MSQPTEQTDQIERTVPDLLPLPEEVRADFPILAREINGRTIAYLDNAATTQKPLGVIEAIDRYFGVESR